MDTNFANSATTGINFYKFCAECASDAHSVRGVLHPWLLNWTEERAVDDLEGEPVATGSVTVEFSLQPGSPQLGELYWLLDMIPNAHAAAETLETKAQYTGEQVFRRRWQLPASCPNDGVLELLSRSLKSQGKVAAIQHQRCLETYRVVETSRKAGNNWSKKAAALDHPGALLMLGNGVPDVYVVRSVCASLGASGKGAGSKARVDERVMLLCG